MNRPLWFVLFSLLVLATSGSCFVGDDASVTCDNFARFQHDCTDNCTVSWDCEAYYDDLSVGDQIDLDECSDCLADGLAEGVCADCSVPGVGSCHAFMEDLLGDDSDCW